LSLIRQITGINVIHKHTAAGGTPCSTALLATSVRASTKSSQANYSATKVVAAVMIDRLVHHAEVIALKDLDAPGVALAG
jgi:hypothetical protein